MSRLIFVLLTASMLVVVGSACAASSKSSDGIVVKIGERRTFTATELRPGTRISCTFRGHTLSVIAPPLRQPGGAVGAVWPGPTKDRFHLNATLQPGGGYVVTCGRGGYHSEPVHF